MCRTALLGFALVCALAGPVHAVPDNCTTMSTLDQFIAQSEAGGCCVQGKLFTSFSYTREPGARSLRHALPHQQHLLLRRARFRARDGESSLALGALAVRKRRAQIQKDSARSS